MAIVGIDLGTTNSLVSVCRNGSVQLIPNTFGEFLTPSVVSIDEDGMILVGKIAKERLSSHPHQTAASFKRFMGTAKQYKLGEKLFYPEDLSSMILRQLKEDAEKYLNEEVTEAVISVPAYFNNNQRAATKTAGKLAGLTVERIINEPSAAAISYKHHLEKNGTFLVFDLGGGTLDVSIVDIFDNVVDILAVSGDNHLGGNNFDDVIEAYFLTKHPDLKNRITPQKKSHIKNLAEKCKIALSSNNPVYMVYSDNETQYTTGLTEEELFKISAPLFGTIKETIKRALRDSALSMEQIDDIILIGGSTKMPLIQKYIKYLSNKEPLCDTDPDHAVALGAAMVSGIKQRQEGIRDTVLVDVCPFTLGIAAVFDFNNTLQMSPIIERNASLPTSREERYSTVANFQKEIKVRVFQGESLDIEKNLLLGEIQITVPPLPAGEASIRVRFTYDINGILDVDVVCDNNGNRAHKLIIQDSNLSQDKIEERLKELEGLKISPREENENRLLIARAQRLYEENSGMMRDYIHSELDRFLFVIESRQSLTETMKARQRLESILGQVDDFDYGLSL